MAFFGTAQCAWTNHNILQNQVELINYEALNIIYVWTMPRDIHIEEEPTKYTNQTLPDSD